MNSSLFRMANNAVSGLNTQVQQGFDDMRDAATTVAAPLIPKNIGLPPAASNALNSFNTQVQQGFNGMRDTVTNAAAAVAAPLNSLPKNLGMPSPPKNMSMPAASKNANVSSLSTMGAAAWAMPLGIFITLFVLFIVLFSTFTNEIRAGYENLANAIRSAFGSQPAPTQPITVTMTPPTTDNMHHQEIPTTTQSIVEKILPIGSAPEVFNVSKNDFNYYDAEPLCKALGAELATYDQVKEAYGKGADWCNYGWVKGQVAIYPTQKATYDDLQKGDEDERNACGKPGVNGGYFDNPDMKFGVNCYGPKPSQSGHDEAELMKQGRIPTTTALLKTEQKMRQFQKQADQFGILPFNEDKWQSS
jgi:hypothetical protein